MFRMAEQPILFFLKKDVLARFKGRRFSGLNNGYSMCYVSRVEEHTRALKMEGTREHFNEHAHAAIPLYTTSTYRTTYHLLP